MIDKLVINPKEYDIKLVYAKGKNVKQIAEENNADIAFGFSFVDYKGTGELYGETYVDGKKIFSDIPKTVKRSGFGIKDGIPYIGQYKEGSSSFSKAGPLLVSNGKDVRVQQIKIEQIQSDVADSKRDRIGIGLRDGLITLLYTKGDITLADLTKKALDERLEVFNNGDGGESVTVYKKGEGVINRTGYLRPICHAWVFVKKGGSKVPELIIDPGHGGKDGGGGSNQHWKEKDMNLKISLYQHARFTELGLDVALTRDKDIYLSPEERTSIIKSSGAKYCISNHINSAGGKGDGAETIHSIYNDGKLAKKLADSISDAGQNIRRVFTRTLSSDPKKDYYFMHRDTGKVSTVIIEYGFADSTLDDVQQLLDYWQDYAEAVVKGYCEYIGYKYVAPVKENLPTIDGIANIKYYGKSLKGYLTSDKKSVVEVRQLCEMLGYKVEWDSKTSTVEIKLPS